MQNSISIVLDGSLAKIFGHIRFTLSDKMIKLGLTQILEIYNLTGVILEKSGCLTPQTARFFQNDKKSRLG